MNVDHFARVTVLATKMESVAEGYQGRHDKEIALSLDCSRFWSEAFEGAGRLDLRGAIFSGGTFVGSALRGADCRDAHFADTRWYFTNVEEAAFDGAVFARSLFFSLHCGKASFISARITGSAIVMVTAGTDLSGAELDSTELVFGSDFCAPKVDGAVFRNCTVRGQHSDGQRAAKAFVKTLTPAQQAGIKLQGNCFIATAACGTDTAPAVLDLQRFRDEVLTASRPGRALANAYYRLSPPVAAWIEPRPAVRRLVRIMIIGPARVVAKGWRRFL
jgi:hypothetical protein